MKNNMQLAVNVQRVSLESLFEAAYYQDVAAKSAIGIGVLNINTASTHALACFFVGKTCTHAYLAVWSFHFIGNDNFQFMAVRVGASSEALGFSVLTSYANPARAATQLRLASLGGRYNLTNTEAAIMATTPSIRLPEIQVINGQPVTSSLTIADYFTKRHDDVLKKISNLDCSPEFNARNFAAVEYSDLKGEKRPAYHITRDGFTFLAMSFTGKRAAAFKEAYINAFNKMEQQLHARQPASLFDLYNQENTAKGLLAMLRQLRTLTDDHICPMLEAANSPLTPRIYSLVNESVFIAQLLQGRVMK